MSRSGFSTVARSSTVPVASSTLLSTKSSTPLWVGSSSPVSAMQHRRAALPLLVRPCRCRASRWYSRNERSSTVKEK